MKVVLINYSGTVGKTTAGAHLLAPRMGNARIFAIETINETAEGLGMDVEKIKGERFKDLFRQIMLLDDAIIDVGASNVEAMLDGILRYEGSQVEFDYFVVPVLSGIKEQKESISMIMTLREMGIQADKIRILFNRVHENVQEEFLPILNFAARENACIANTDAKLFETELFDMLHTKKMSIAELLSDEKDYRTLARALPLDADDKLRMHYTQMHIMKSLARGIMPQLDSAFKALFA